MSAERESGWPRPGPVWIVPGLLLLALVGLGVFGYAQQRIHGDVVTGLRTIGAGGVAWGLYIVFDIALAGLAFAGIAVPTIARIFRLRDLRPFGRIALLMAVISLAMAGLCVLADLGRPLHGLLSLPRYARPQSPFFGTFTMIIGAGLTAGVVHLYLGSRADAARLARSEPRLRWLYRLWACGYHDTEVERSRHRVASLLLSLVIFPLMVVAYSTLGFVFGIQGGRPGWFSALQAPGFLVLAAISGTGLLLFLAGAARQLGFGDELPERAFRWLSNTLWLLLLVCFYFVAVEELTARYAAQEAQTDVARSMDSGVYAPIFWSSVALFIGCFLVLFVQFLRRRISIPMLMTVGILVNVAALLRRVLIVVPSQTHGTLLPYPIGHYAPTWVELSVVAGLLALGTLIFLVFAAIFPLVPLQAIGPVQMPHVAVRRPLRRFVRLSLFWTTLTVGLAIATTGLLLSSRVGTLYYLDPIVPYSPVIFLIGLALSLGSAVVYETVPRALTPPESPEPARL